jgi:hypothetical protein
METPGNLEERTLESLRETARILEKGLTEARCAIAEIEARLTWSHSRVSDTSLFKRDRFGASQEPKPSTPPPPNPS